MRFRGQPNFLVSWESTPMADIIFNLLLFFLLTASFAAETGLELALPRAVEPSVLPAEEVVVTLTRSGQLYINELEVPWKEMEPQLAGAIRRAERHRVVLRGDEGVELGRVVEVLDAARRNGAEGMSLAAEARVRSDGPPGR